MEKAWSPALWSVLVCRIAIITDNSKGGGRHRSHPKAERTEQMKIEKNDMVMVYDGGGTVRVSSVETMHERRYTVDDWRYDTAHREQTENGQKG